MVILAFRQLRYEFDLKGGKQNTFTPHMILN